MVEPDLRRWAEVLIETGVTDSIDMLTISLQQIYNKGVVIGKREADKNWWAEQDAEIKNRTGR